LPKNSFSDFLNMRRCFLQGEAMRILTGKYKGKKILIPSGIRPTQEKVRKAIFDILQDVEGLDFLELYAGSGAVGFEALSRGCRSLTMVENNRNCLKVLQKNIEALKLDKGSLLPISAEDAIVRFCKKGLAFDIIFLDPPYYYNQAKKTLQLLSAYDILAPNGFIITQYSKNETLPEELGELRLLRRYRYGDTLLAVYQKIGSFSKRMFLEM